MLVKACMCEMSSNKGRKPAGSVRKRPSTLSGNLGAPTSDTVISPSPNDVLFGRGRRYDSHPGNLELRALVDSNVVRYYSTPSRSGKTRIAQEVLRKVSVSGRFLKYSEDSGIWTEVSLSSARVKVSQAFRYRQRQITSPGQQPGISLEAFDPQMAAGIPAALRLGGGGPGMVPTQFSAGSNLSRALAMHSTAQNQMQQSMTQQSTSSSYPNPTTNAQLISLSGGSCSGSFSQAAAAPVLMGTPASTTTTAISQPDSRNSTAAERVFFNIKSSSDHSGTAAMPPPKIAPNDRLGLSAISGVQGAEKPISAASLFDSLPIWVETPMEPTPINPSLLSGKSSLRAAAASDGSSAARTNTTSSQDQAPDIALLTDDDIMRSLGYSRQENAGSSGGSSTTDHRNHQNHLHHQSIPSLPSQPQHQQNIHPYLLLQQQHQHQQRYAMPPSQAGGAPSSSAGIFPSIGDSSVAGMQHSLAADNIGSSGAHSNFTNRFQLQQNSNWLTQQQRQQPGLFPSAPADTTVAFAMPPNDGSATAIASSQKGNGDSPLSSDTLQLGRELMHDFSNSDVSEDH